MFVVSCETDSSESMLIFSVDKCIIDGEWIYKFLCLLKDRLQPDVTPRLRTSALGLIILWSSKTRGSMSAWAKYLEMGFIWVEFETILPHKILNNLETSSYLLSSIWFTPRRKPSQNWVSSAYRWHSAPSFNSSSDRLDIKLLNKTGVW